MNHSAAIKFVLSVLLLCAIGCTGGMQSSVESSASSASGTSAAPTPSPAPVAASTASPYVPADYTLTFDDEFTSINTISSGPGPYTAGVNWYNGTEQCCMSDTTNNLPAVMFPTAVNGLSVNPYSLMTGGGLNITLSKNNSVWHSGVITSVDSKGVGFSQQYGYFEMKAKLPPGPGTWPGWWMLSTTSLSAGVTGGEIDIFEQYGQFPNAFCMTLHDWAGGTTPYQNCNISVADQTSAFHTYGFLWTASAMTVFFDGTTVATTSTPTVMQQPYYMLVDLGLGGGWPTGSTPISNTMQIQYVRAYAPSH